MAETTADVRRDIELTRERMSDTIAQIEHKVNVAQIVRDHPWPALGLAAGAGFLLANSNSDVKAAAATVAATNGASSKLGTVLDDLSARLITALSDTFNQRVDEWVGELKSALGAPNGEQQTRPTGDGRGTMRSESSMLTQDQGTSRATGTTSSLAH
jgi:hypothetical protein